METNVDLKAFLDSRPDIVDYKIPEDTSIFQIVNELPEDIKSNFIAIPVDFKRSFETNIISALQDIAGESVAPKGKLFTSRMHYRKAIITEIEHPFTKECYRELFFRFHFLKMDLIL